MEEAKEIDSSASIRPPGLWRHLVRDRLRNKARAVGLFLVLDDPAII